MDSSSQARSSSAVMEDGMLPTYRQMRSETYSAGTFARLVSSEVLEDGVPERDEGRFIACGAGEEVEAEADAEAEEDVEVESEVDRGGTLRAEVLGVLLADLASSSLTIAGDSSSIFAFFCSLPALRGGGLPGSRMPFGVSSSSRFLLPVGELFAPVEGPSPRSLPFSSGISGFSSLLGSGLTAGFVSGELYRGVGMTESWSLKRTPPAAAGVGAFDLA